MTFLSDLWYVLTGRRQEKYYFTVIPFITREKAECALKESRYLGYVVCSSREDLR